MEKNEDKSHFPLDVVRVYIGFFGGRAPPMNDSAVIDVLEDFVRKCKIRMFVQTKGTHVRERARRQATVAA